MAFSVWVESASGSFSGIESRVVRTSRIFISHHLGRGSGRRQDGLAPVPAILFGEIAESQDVFAGKNDVFSWDMVVVLVLDSVLAPRLKS